MDTLLKNALKNELGRRLAQAQEVRKVVVFGSFLHNEAPEDAGHGLCVNDGLVNPAMHNSSGASTIRPAMCYA